MFYSQFILAKKGPLGTIWIAAHLERKLRKNQVADTDIGVSVDSILCPEVPIALRLSSHLLLGVVRIYSRKVNYLFDDCSEALLKVKQAFRSTAVDLPPEQSKAPYHSITLPETFDLDDFELPDNEILQGNYVDHHVSAKEQITLQDTLDGAAFPTSQFGPDERFGDGDVSQIGLDLDEDLFLDKGEAAGTSDFLSNTDTEHQAPTKDAAPFEDDEQNEEVSDLPIGSPKNCFSIQAPPTPGLLEKPNLPSAQEGLICDDHMDEDQNPPGLATKEVSENASGQAGPSDIHSLECHSNGNCHLMSEQENEKAKSQGAILSHEASELTISVDALPPKSDEYVGEGDGIYSPGDKPDCNPLRNEKVMAADIHSKGHSNHDFVGVNGMDISSAENVNFLENHDHFLCGVGGGETDVNGTCISISDNGTENIISSTDNVIVSTEEAEGMMVSSGSECQNAGHLCQNRKDAETFESIGDKKLSAFSSPVLQACNLSICTSHDGEENLADAANHRAEDDGIGICERDNASSVSGISTDLDMTRTILKGDEITCQVTSEDNSNSDRLQDNINTGEDQAQKENNSEVSEFSAPEKLLSLPNAPIGPSDNVLVEFTPDKDIPQEDVDASGEKFTSGRKRSYTESTLTIQSLNSADSSGAAQSKQSAEFIPDDDDLLSSILAGKRSSTLKMKPTPPPSDSIPAKRQRTCARSSAPKRKVLVDDTMVLHGDTIRQQLINTEDIRRVRKKAPCTRLEVWMLQKRFLEDEVFSEPVCTGMSLALRSSHCQAFDLSAIRFVQGDGSKGTNDTDISTRPMLAEEAETMGTPVPSPAGDMGSQEHIDGLKGNSFRQDWTFVVDGSTLQKELETFDNEVAKQMSQYEVAGKNIETEDGNDGVQARGEAESSVATEAEPTTSVCPVSIATCDLADSNTVDEPNVNKVTDVDVPMDIDASCHLVDQGNYMECTREDASMMEGVSSSGRRDDEVADFNISEKVELDEKSNGDHIFEKMEGPDLAETVVATANLDDTSSLAVCDGTDSVGLEGRASPTSDKIMEELQLGEPGCENKDEINVSDIGHGGGSPASNIFLGEDVKLDTLATVEVDLNSEDTGFNDRENLECWQAGPNIVMDSTASPTVFISSTDHTDVGREGIEHDTDFLNVDDDEVDEDYESDLPDAKEKRIFDNSGWSSRTRAVANYIQVLFEKEANQSNKVISLNSLLAGKSRKEASRMFFETLVLKTKDYIHAEQEGSFCDIKIKPMGKLLKSGF